MDGEILVLTLTTLLAISVQCIVIREFEQPATISPPAMDTGIEQREKMFCSSIIRIIGQILEKLIGITTEATKFCIKRS